MEQEYYSHCCTAPPLYDLYLEENIIPIGVCMKCRDNTGFEIITEKGE